MTLRRGDTTRKSRVKGGAKCPSPCPLWVEGDHDCGICRAYDEHSCGACDPMFVHRGRCYLDCRCPPGTRHTSLGEPIPRREPSAPTPQERERDATWAQAFAKSRTQPDGHDRLRRLVRARRWQGRPEDWINEEMTALTESSDFHEELRSRLESPARVVVEAERVANGGIITRHLEDLASVAEDPEWVIEDWLAAQVVHGLVGLPNASKTWIMGAEGAAISLGLPLGIGREDGRQERAIAGHGVAYFLWLDAPERQLKLRLGNIYEAACGDRSPQGAAIGWTLEPVSVFDARWWEVLGDALRDEEDRYGLPARYLGIDHAMHIGINNRDFASGIMEFQVGLAQLRLAFPRLAVRLLIHAPRRVSWGAVLARGARDAPWGGVRVAQAMDATAIVEMAGPDPTRNYRGLAIQSRDLPAQEVIGLSFGTDRRVFDLRTEPIGDLTEKTEQGERKTAQSGSMGKYLRAIDELGDRANATQIAEAARVTRQVAARALAKLASEGVIHRKGNVWHRGARGEQGEF